MVKFEEDFAEATKHLVQLGYISETATALNN